MRNPPLTPIIPVVHASDKVTRQHILSKVRSNIILLSLCSKGTYEDCEIKNVKLAGVWVRNQASPVMRRNKVHHGRDVGFFIFDYGLVSLTSQYYYFKVIGICVSLIRTLSYTGSVHYYKNLRCPVTNLIVNNISHPLSVFYYYSIVI